MAEIAPLIVPLVVDLLVLPAIKKVVSKMSAEPKMNNIREQLQWMNTLKKANDSQETDDDNEGLWKSKMRDVAYEIEDVIEDFILEVESRDEKNRVQKAISRSRKWFQMEKIAKKIENIDGQIKNIKENCKKYDLSGIRGSSAMPSSSNCETWGRWRKFFPHVERRDIIVGLDKAIPELVADLRKVETNHQRRVVSIIGMGGSGKTTLATQVYNHQDVRTHFNCRGWAYVSKAYNMKDVLLSILRGVDQQPGTDTASMSDEDLIQHLHQVLRRELYLVFLDDVWSRGAWESLSSAFPDGKPGSKVMLTSRDKGVATCADRERKPYEPRCLTETDGWDLLWKTAFQRENPAPDKDFEEPGKDIVRSCGGLPLALVVLGGLLSARPTSRQWREVWENIRWYLHDTEEKRIRKILDLSYMDLPYHLKACFLNLGIYAEGTEISAKKLIRVWIAEEFVPRQGEEIVEASAARLLEQLVSRCMVEAVKLSHSGEIKTCRIHNVLREFSLEKAKEEKFHDVFHGDHSMLRSSSSINAEAPRLAISPKSDRYVYPEVKSRRLRSLFFFNKKLYGSTPVSSNPLIQNQKLKLLRVLHLDGVTVDKTGSFYGEIGSLIHLRYLALKRTTNLPELPESVGKLRSLQTLDLKDSNLTKIPDVLWKMMQLRHIILDTYQGLDLRVHTLTNLQTLDCGAPDCKLEGLGQLINLRKLKLREMSKSQVDIVLTSMIRLTCLGSLSLSFPRDGKTASTFPEHLNLLYSCNSLVELTLRGKLDKLPDLSEIRPNLTKLTLAASKLVQDPMATLGKLSNLSFLRLGESSFKGAEMVCNANGFPKLQVLQIRNLEELQTWTVENAAMPQLRCLEIENCSDLAMVPEGLKNITTLHELSIVSMPAAFQNSLRRGGVDFYKVQHIANREFVRMRQRGEVF